MASLLAKHIQLRRTVAIDQAPVFADAAAAPSAITKSADPISDNPRS